MEEGLREAITFFMWPTWGGFYEALPYLALTVWTLVSSLVGYYRTGRWAGGVAWKLSRWAGGKILSLLKKSELESALTAVMKKDPCMYDRVTDQLSFPLRGVGVWFGRPCKISGEGRYLDTRIMQGGVDCYQYLSRGEKRRLLKLATKRRAPELLQIEKERKAQARRGREDALQELAKIEKTVGKPLPGAPWDVPPITLTAEEVHLDFGGLTGYGDTPPPTNPTARKCK